MNILGIESSALSAGAAIMQNGKIVAESYLNSGLTHSETLLPQIDEVLKKAKIDISEIDLFAASDGPGSFTGLRIGVGTLKGLAMAQGKPCVGVSPLMSLAYNVSVFDGLICPIMDARRAEVYNAIYRFEDAQIKEVCEKRAIPIDALCMEISEKTIFVGDGVPVYKERIKEILKDKAFFAPENLCYQRASGIVMAAQNIAPVSADEILPGYIRKPQAEREYEERQKEIKK